MRKQVVLPNSLLQLAIMMLLLTTINKSCSSARTIGNPTPNHHYHVHGHHKITFLMRHVLNGTEKKPPPATTSQLPFPRKPPVGLFPPPTNKGINIPPIPQTTAVLDLSTFIGFSFPTRAALQELEFGSVTSIDEELLEGEGDDDDDDDELIKKVGKAQGVYVISSDSEDIGSSSSHMVAITATFGNQDGLTLFGVHKTDVFESHVAVIGGTGNYYGANGYAVVKVVDRVGSVEGKGKVTTSKFLLFDVYFS